jgi:hypothetical protein
LREAAQLLAQCVQEQEGTPVLSAAQHAVLLQGCAEAVGQEVAASANMWEQAQACLYTVLLSEPAVRGWH